MPLEQSFEGIAQIASQVPPIRDLGCTRRTLLRPLGKGIGAITRDDPYAWMFLEPGSKLLGAIIGQQIEHLMTLKIDHNRAVVAPFALGPLVDANNLRCSNGWRWKLSHPSEECIRTDRQRQTVREAVASFTTERETEAAQQVVQARRVLRIGTSQRGDLLHKSGARTRRRATEKAAHAQAQADRPATPG